MNKELLLSFYEKTSSLALLRTVRTDGSYADFIKSVSIAFDKAKTNESKNHFLKFFLQPLINQDFSDQETELSDISQLFFSTCGPSIKAALKKYRGFVTPDSPIASKVKNQFDIYQAQVEAEDKRRQEAEERDRALRKEQERARLKEKEARRKVKEEEDKKKEKERQKEIQKKETKRKRAEGFQNLLKWAALAFSIIPLIAFGYESIVSWLTISNYSAISFYVIFCFGSIFVIRGIINRPGDYIMQFLDFDVTRDGWAGWLTAALMTTITFLIWEQVPNAGKALCIAGTIGLPFTPILRGVMGSVGAGIIAAFVSQYAARFCGFIVMTFIGWVAK